MTTQINNNIWDLPKEVRDEIFKVQLEKYSQFMSLPEEKREELYYSNFLNKISEFSQERQDELKEEYKIVYKEMIEKREWINEQQHINCEKYPGGLTRSYANYYASGNFGVYWEQKMVVYEP
jgi:hypothetical protein